MPDYGNDPGIQRLKKFLNSLDQGYINGRGGLTDRDLARMSPRQILSFFGEGKDDRALGRAMLMAQMGTTEYAIENDPFLAPVQQDIQRNAREAGRNIRQRRAEGQKGFALAPKTNLGYIVEITDASKKRLRGEKGRYEKWDFASIPTHLQKAHQEILHLFEAAVKEEFAPHSKTGNTLGTIQIEQVSGWFSRLYIGGGGAYVEFGASEHEIHPAQAQALKFSNAGDVQFAAAVYEHPGITRDPFIERAEERIGPVMNTFLRRNIQATAPALRPIPANDVF
jgi:hypothetical protein